MSLVLEARARPARFRSSARSSFRFFSRLGKRELTWLLLAAVASLGIHAKYRLTGFGEQDAARLARDAIVWHLRQQILSDESTYRMHTSGGYIHVLKLLLDHGLPIAKLPAVMNVAGVGMATLTAFALYALFREFSSPRQAGLALLMYSFTPGFWLGSIYGMPTVPALGCFALSVLCFVRASRVARLRSSRLVLLVAASLLGSFLAISLKADIVLCTGVFVVAALAARGRRLVMFGLSSLVVFGSVVANNRYTAALLTINENGSASEVLFDRSKHFPFELSALLEVGNSQTIAHCAGTFLFGVLVVAVLSALISGGRRRRVALVALVWAVPPILFWGLQRGNTARHSVFGLAPVFLVASQFVFRAVDDRAARAFVLGLALLSASYVSDTKSRGVVVPASNLLDAAERLENTTRGFHERGRKKARTTSPKRIVAGADAASPYLDFEVFAAAKQPVMPGSWELHDGEQVTIFAHTSNRRRRARNEKEYRQQGYVVLAQ